MCMEELQELKDFPFIMTNKMKGILAIILFIFCGVLSLGAQSWAGRDTTTCGELGVRIGSDDPCENCCYFWTPSAGLSDNKVKNPIAKPATKTVYTVEVTDQHLRSKGKDEVEVDLDFGEMKFSKDFLIQGSEETATVELLKKKGITNPSHITWSILPDQLNSMIEAQGVNAMITAGDRYGTITVRAINNSVPGCYTDGTLDINNGVKDVVAVDPDSPMRKAITGGTLHLIDQTDVEIEAIPNPVGFKNGVPDWKEDSYGSQTIPDGVAKQSMNEDTDSDGRTSQYIAGDAPEFSPLVTVKRYTARPVVEVPFGLGGISEIISKVEELFAGYVDDPPNIICGPAFPFSFELAILNLKYTQQDIEKYNSPDLGKKHEIAFEGEMQASGRVYHPVFTKSFNSKYFDIIICSRLYLYIATSAAAGVKVVKDESQADDSWTPQDPEVTLNFKIGGAAQGTVNSPNFIVTGEASFNTGAKITFKYAENQIQGIPAVNPLTAKLSLQVQKLGDMGKYEDVFGGLLNVSKEVELIKGIEFAPVVMYNFN